MRSMIEEWQKRAHFSEEVRVGRRDDPGRRPALSGARREDQSGCETKIAEVAKDSKIAKTLRSIPGFGAGVHFRIGRRDRHRRALYLEGSLALVSRHVHVGQQFGKVSRDQSAQARQHASQSGDDDRPWIDIESMSRSRRDTTKRNEAEGKKHNQAIRALGRHLCRIIYKMLKEEREYELRPEKGNSQGQGQSVACVKTQIRRPKKSVKNKK